MGVEKTTVVFVFQIYSHEFGRKNIDPCSYYYKIRLSWPEQQSYKACLDSYEGPCILSLLFTRHTTLISVSYVSCELHFSHTRWSCEEYASFCVTLLSSTQALRDCSKCYVTYLTYLQTKLIRGFQEYIFAHPLFLLFCHRKRYKQRLVLTNRWMICLCLGTFVS